MKNRHPRSMTRGIPTPRPTATATVGKLSPPPPPSVAAADLSQLGREGLTNKHDGSVVLHRAKGGSFSEIHSPGLPGCTTKRRKVDIPCQLFTLPVRLLLLTSLQKKGKKNRKTPSAKVRGKDKLIHRRQLNSTVESQNSHNINRGKCACGCPGLRQLSFKRACIQP